MSRKWGLVSGFFPQIKSQLYNFNLCRETFCSSLVLVYDYNGFTTDYWLILRPLYCSLKLRTRDELKFSQSYYYSISHIGIRWCGFKRCGFLIGSDCFPDVLNSVEAYVFYAFTFTLSDSSCQGVFVLTCY